MGYLKERLKHAIRFRHKRGYGVHSPFMFNLILNVIRDREKRFSYPVELEQANILNRRERKVFRLLARLIRHLRVHRIVCLGLNSSLLASYLSMVYQEADVCDVPDRLSDADFVYIGRRTLAFINLLNDEEWIKDYPKYIVIADIYKDARHARLWRQLNEKATVSVDMMWYGLLFFDRKIQKGRYRLII